MEGMNLMAAFHNNPHYKEHFRKLSALFEEVERVTLQRWEVEGKGLLVSEVDTYLQQEGVNVSGAAVLWAMLKQSDLVRLSQDEKSIEPKSREEVKS